ncbi:MAG: hypothetical protein ACWA41_07360 [Putridiphycobacter sp.]
MNKINRLITVFLLSLFLFSCSDNKINQGEIVYEITYPYTKVSGLMEMMLPKEMTVQFKDSKSIATIKKGKMFTTQIVADGETKTLEMRLDFGSDVLNTVLSPEDLKDFKASQPKYDMTKVGASDSLVGCSTVKYTADCTADTLPKFDCVFTEDFSIQDISWFSGYDNTKGFPLVYAIDRYGIFMQLTAVKFTPKEIKDKAFDPTENYEKVSFKKYDHKINELYEIMTE